MSKFDRWIKNYRTYLSALIGMVFLVLARPNPRSLLLGLFLIIPGESLRIWSSGYIHKNRVLSTTGPYCLTRNPLYLGSFLMGLGFMVSMGILWMAALFLIFFVYIYWFTIKWEEDKLRRTFPGQWEEYAKKVPRFFPLVRAKGYLPGEFRWSQVSRNRELWNVLIVLIVYIILWGKYLLLSDI